MPAVTGNLPDDLKDAHLRGKLGWMASSFERFTGRPLVGAAAGSLIRSLWDAPFVIVAHGVEDDPVFFFGNAVALAAFETDWPTFTAMPSRFSAQAPAREERQRLLERVTGHGFIDDYAGMRISASGRRFAIGPAVVWNILDEDGNRHGQAATFAVPLP